MISQKLKDEIWDYCRMNDITNVDDFIERMVQQGYNIEKYGNAPLDLKPIEIEVEKIVEVEVVKEVVKEVPVEVIKEIEVVKEVPVEVIKEVEKVVEKEVYVTDDEITNNLQKELEKTRTILKDTIEGFDTERKANSKIQKEKDDENDVLNRKISDLNNKISQLEFELEEEKKKPKREKKEIKLPESNTPRSAINWVSKNERDRDNLYDD
jgi:hypothetical protein